MAISAPALDVASHDPAKINEPWAIFGRGGDDVITGGNADDILVGEGGNDVLNGGKGNDTFLVTASTPADGFDTFNGGDGYDRIVSTGNGVDIRVAGLSSIEEINAGGFTGVNIAGATGAHNTLAVRPDVDVKADLDILRGLSLGIALHRCRWLLRQNSDRSGEPDQAAKGEGNQRSVLSISMHHVVP